MTPVMVFQVACALFSMTMAYVSVRSLFHSAAPEPTVDPEWDELLERLKGPTDDRWERGNRIDDILERLKVVEERLGIYYKDA